MKPAVFGVGAAAATGGVLALVLIGGPREVKLPVYEKPVEFFPETQQALLIGNLPHGVSSLSAEACASCHEEEHAEWKVSGHARSVTEPIFTAAFKAEPRALCR